MTLNLLRDPWIPVIRNGRAVDIRPDQIAESDVTGLAWQRPDFNLACLELLIGLISIADPPRDEEEWRHCFGRSDGDRLRNALVPFHPYFELAGMGPRFLQDYEPFEQDVKESDARTVDMLLIDSSGMNTAKNNGDLMVKRNRFSSLSAPEGAMALYTLQAYAPSGGSGNRTSMRGGGPMTTLVQPLNFDSAPMPLWRLVYANVRPNRISDIDETVAALPWLRPTRTSESNQTVTVDETHPLEAFFGMPRRLRLLFEENRVTGFVQRPYGTNYTAWQHPLTPYYRQNEESAEWLPVRPRPGRLSYRNWLGIIMRSGGGIKGTRRTAQTVRECDNRPGMPFEILAGGWAMDNMKPLDFCLSRYQSFPGLQEEDMDRVQLLVEAANAASGKLVQSLKKALRIEGEATAAVTELFFAETEQEFSEMVRRINERESGEVESDWHKRLRKKAVEMFEERIVPGLADRDLSSTERQIMARIWLLANIDRDVRRILGLPAPEKKGRRR